MTDRELLEKLLEKVSSMETKINSMETKINSMETKINSLEIKINSLEIKINSMEKDISYMKSDIQSLKHVQEEIKDHIMEMEVKNANNHIEIRNKIDKLSQDLTVIEVISGKNLSDIAYLKSIK